MQTCCRVGCLLFNGRHSYLYCMPPTSRDQSYSTGFVGSQFLLPPSDAAIEKFSIVLHDRCRSRIERPMHCNIYRTVHPWSTECWKVMKTFQYDVQDECGGSLGIEGKSEYWKVYWKVLQLGGKPLKASHRPSVPRVQRRSPPPIFCPTILRIRPVRNFIEKVPLCYYKATLLQ